MFFHLTFLLQRVLQYTPSQSALSYIPLAITTAFSRRIAALGSFHDRTRWVIFADGASIGAGSAGLSLVRPGSGRGLRMALCWGGATAFVGGVLGAALSRGKRGSGSSASPPWRGGQGDRRSAITSPG